MGLKGFRSDLAAAAQKAQAGGLPGVSSVKRGESDGEIAIDFALEGLPRKVRVQAIAQDSSEYPDGNNFILFTEDDDPPPAIAKLMLKAQDCLVGTSVIEMCTELAKKLAKAVSPEPDADGGDGDDDEDEASEEEDWFGSEDDIEHDEIFGLGARNRSTTNKHARGPARLPRVKSDFRQVREAGFRVGRLEGLDDDCATGMVSMSIRVSKLSLAKEVLEAWDLDSNDYIVLLVRFLEPYWPLEQVLASPAAASTRVSFRIGKCSHYKPTVIQAIQACYGRVERSPRQLPAEPQEPASSESGHGGEFRKMFISNALNQLLNDKLVALIKIREATGCSWDEANKQFNARVKTSTGTNALAPDTIDLTSEQDEKAGPDGEATPAAGQRSVLAADHLLDCRNQIGTRSFPLLAMQFAMRYLIRCTAFCLRCHWRLPPGFEALRPYVCEDPLCLFQYLSMGLGPNLEHEILTEPLVVDLLVSLCYVACQPDPTGLSKPGSSKTLPIRNLPVGLRLQAPGFMCPDPGARTAPAALEAQKQVYNMSMMLRFDQAIDLRDPRLSLGAWVIISHSQSVEVAVITFVSIDGNYAVVQPTIPRKGPENEATSVRVYFYDTDFDSLSELDKGKAMCQILDSLPPIADIEEYLRGDPHRTVRSMDGVSPQAFSLLQWIVSSNRSCIYQVSTPSPALGQKGQTTQPTPAASTKAPDDRISSRKSELIPGMSGWIQFRFAQGAPDREMRFKLAMEQAANLAGDADWIPTLFAWHGSHLMNWHSIIRNGLDFKDIRCGRAYGDGVYFSPLYATSRAYAGWAEPPKSWPNSSIGAKTCMSVNEIINRPQNFVSTNPHYVVNQVAWIQTRWLFVQRNTIDVGNGGSRFQPKAQAEVKLKPSELHRQQPGREIVGPDNKKLQLPRAAVPQRTIAVLEATKEAKGVAKRTPKEPEPASDDEDPEDALFLADSEARRDDDDDENDDTYSPPHKRVTTELASRSSRREGASSKPPPQDHSHLTDFRPGTLDLSTLPRLEPPSFANDAARKALGRELRRLQKAHAATPLHELGWHVDFGAVSNMFQWVVELHTFEASLPLARDLKAVGATSVVLEVRFGADFPFSPPFVRVVRPRFLPFAEGGGGHVTAGGAVCMELLTGSGWSPANSMESVLLQVRLALSSRDPRPARLMSACGRGGYAGDYGVAEAVNAYIRAANVHGWRVPADLHRTAYGV